MIFDRSIARIYVGEIRHKMDGTVVAMFPPDVLLRVGDFGSFENGRFVRKGSLSSRGFEFSPADPLDKKPLAKGPVTIAIDQQPTEAFDFASSGKVNFGVSTKIEVQGNELLKGAISFTGGNAVAAGFAEGIQRQPLETDDFAESVLALWKVGELAPNRLVVSEVRRARSGTIIVSAEGGNEVEVVAPISAAPLGLSLASLQAGVQFGSERKASWKMSSSHDLTVYVKLLGFHRGKVKDAFGFEDGGQPKAGDIGTFDNQGLLELLDQPP